MRRPEKVWFAKKKLFHSDKVYPTQTKKLSYLGKHNETTLISWVLAWKAYMVKSTVHVISYVENKTQVVHDQGFCQKHIKV